MADHLQAAPIGPPDGLRAALGALNIIEKTQVFDWHGRRYCWYDDGWHGPGFYWCGYARRHGLGWGGGLAGTDGNRASSRKVPSRRVPSRKVASRKASSRKVVNRKVVSRKLASRRVPSRKVASRKASSRKVVNRKVVKINRRIIRIEVALGRRLEQ